MANGQAGECFWTVDFRRVDEESGIWTYNPDVSGKFPTEAEAYAYVPELLEILKTTVNPGIDHLTWVHRLCCGRPIPGEA